MTTIRVRAIIVAGLLFFAQSAVAGVLVSDDFSGQNLNQTLWTPIDPIGDGSFSVNNGELRISVGGGVQHILQSS